MVSGTDVMNVLALLSFPSLFLRLLAMQGKQSSNKAPAAEPLWIMSDVYKINFRHTEMSKS